MPATETYTTNDAGSQNGFNVGAAWVDELSGSYAQTLLLDTNLSRNGLGLQLDLPDLSPSTPTLATASLSLERLNASVVNVGQVEVRILFGTDQTRYSASQLAGARGEVALTDPFVLPSITGVFAVVLDPSVFAAAINHALNSARVVTLAIVPVAGTGRVEGQFAGSGHATAQVPTLTLTTVPAFTGVLGGPMNMPVRAVLDSRFGFPAFSDELVPDGDQPGLWVRPEHWDPEDRQQEYEPSPTEGTVDDEIPGVV